MVSFIAAYVIVWLAVVLYLGRLELRQRRLQQMLEALRSTRSKTEDQEPPARRARAA